MPRTMKLIQRHKISHNRKATKRRSGRRKATKRRSRGRRKILSGGALAGREGGERERDREAERALRIDTDAPLFVYGAWCQKKKTRLGMAGAWIRCYAQISKSKNGAGLSFLSQKSSQWFSSHSERGEAKLRGGEHVIT